MTRVLLLAAALSACVPTHRVAVRDARPTPDWAIGGDFSLVCLAGSATALTYNEGSAVFYPAFAAYVGLILIDAWTVR